MNVSCHVICGCVGVWVYGCVGVWEYECVGVWVSHFTIDLQFDTNGCVVLHM